MLDEYDLLAGVPVPREPPPKVSSAAEKVEAGPRSWHGLKLTIEHPAGSTRSGTARDGSRWSRTMAAHYGSVRGTEGADAEPVDFFLADDDPGSELAFVVNQLGEDGRFDEHKLVLGTTNAAAARACYLANYPKGWEGLGSIRPFTLPGLKDWLDRADLTKAAAKFAAAYTLRGDVQGVHLRRTLHQILDRYHAGGLAYNDARAGSVHATIDAPAARRKLILADLAARMKANPAVRHWDLVPGARRERLRAVTLTDDDLGRMFDRQGFAPLASGRDAAARRRWAVARYRLAEDPETHALAGRVPDLAYRQLMGTEPVYRGQLTNPRAFGPQRWSEPSDVPKAAADRPPSPPRIILIRRETIVLTPVGGGPEDEPEDEPDRPEPPFTIAVDLDGTLARSDGPFDPRAIEPPRPDAGKWMDAFRAAGARLIVFTVRGDTDLVRRWLDEHEIPYDFVNENPDQPPDSSGKIYADVYWDDRAVDATDLDSGREVLDRIESGREKAAAYAVLLDPEDILAAVLESSIHVKSGTIDVLS